jgi:hypothetical protein
MSDNNEEYPETGAGGGGSTPATDPGTENAVEQDRSTTPQVGYASEGGKFISPNPLNGGEGNTGRARAPSERETAASENSVSEQALLEHVQPAAENIQTQVVPDALGGASMLQSDVGCSVAASANERTTVPGVPHISRETIAEVAIMRTPILRSPEEFFQPYPDILDGNIRRKTLQKYYSKSLHVA